MVQYAPPSKGQIADLCFQAFSIVDYPLNDWKVWIIDVWIAPYIHRLEMATSHDALLIVMCFIVTNIFLAFRFCE